MSQRRSTFCFILSRLQPWGMSLHRKSVRSVHYLKKNTTQNNWLACAIISLMRTCEKSNASEDGNAFSLSAIFESLLFSWILNFTDFYPLKTEIAPDFYAINYSCTLKRRGVFSNPSAFNSRHPALFPFKSFLDPFCYPI